MDTSSVISILKDLLSQHLKEPTGSLSLLRIGGGSINEAFCVYLNGNPALFLKLNSATQFPNLFDREKDGLSHLASIKCIRLPMVIGHYTLDKYQVLILEWIQPGAHNTQFWTRFGEQLAFLHRSSASHFGFHQDNYMGALFQSNKRSQDWCEFFLGERLSPQVKLAADKNLLRPQHVKSLESLGKKLNSIFDEERPSLLHGDLWNGNFMCDDKSNPVLIDPAVYYGHRSMDLAMTTLFGGFERPFYESYNYHFALPGNYEEQWAVSNLYPLLIHLNLFGNSYLPQILQTLKKFV